jgi:hypothetical protein
MAAQEPFRWKCDMQREKWLIKQNKNEKSEVENCKVHRQITNTMVLLLFLLANLCRDVYKKLFYTFAARLIIRKYLSASRSASIFFEP